LPLVDPFFHYGCFDIFCRQIAKLLFDVTLGYVQIARSHAYEAWIQARQLLQCEKGTMTKERPQAGELTLEVGAAPY